MCACWFGSGTALKGPLGCSSGNRSGRPFLKFRWANRFPSLAESLLGARCKRQGTEPSVRRARCMRWTMHMMRNGTQRNEPQQVLSVNVMIVCTGCRFNRNDSTSHGPSISEILFSVSAWVVASAAGCGLTPASMFGVVEVGSVVRIPELARVYHFTRYDSPKCKSKNTAVKNPEFVLLLLVLSLTLMLAEEFNTISNFMCSLEKKGKWWSRNFGVYHHTKHGIVPCEVLMLGDPTMVVTGFTQCNDMRAIPKYQMRKHSARRIPTNPWWEPFVSANEPLSLDCSKVKCQKRQMINVFLTGRNSPVIGRLVNEFSKRKVFGAVLEQGLEIGISYLFASLHFGNDFIKCH